MLQRRMVTVNFLLGVISLFFSPARAANLLTADAAHFAPIRAHIFQFGASVNPGGHTITANTICLLRDGRPWFPIMGEFHYARFPRDQWRNELLKMKAGGISVVSTYVFWIHHEEIEGKWDWSDGRDLGAFVKLAGELGLNVVVRCGPWDHGEVRNGGFPDWLLQKGFKPRTDDPRYLDLVTIFYSQIADQLKGLLWKDGGPVIGIQIENEFYGPPQHLLNLKKIAVDAGLDVPIYTKTGWPALRAPMPFGQMLPMFGAYAEGFWDRNLQPMPGLYWTAFTFSRQRTDRAIATDRFGNRTGGDAADTQAYPFLTCELGPGMETSYHRRILFAPADALAIAMVKLGSGSNLIGYYMYHGGTNPDGALSTLEESQATHYANDMPVKNYDFQAPIGEFGQLRPQYHLLRRLHMALNDIGSDLALMPAFFPDERPKNGKDSTTLRWSVRIDGEKGFVFVSNYQRLQDMPEKKDVQFDVKLPGSDLVIPETPVTIPANSIFFWPFNMDLGGVKLRYATAQYVGHVLDGDTRYLIFAQIPGIPADFAFADKIYHDVPCGTDTAIELHSSGEKIVRIVLLSDEMSLACWKADWKGHNRIFLTKASLIVDDDHLRLTSENDSDLSVAVLPPLSAPDDGVFQRFTAHLPPLPTEQLTMDPIQAAGPPRTIRVAPKGVAQAPTDADFAQAAQWRIHVSPSLDQTAILRFHYIGDVARFTIGGKLFTDNFYNGTPFDVAIGPDAAKQDLRLQILPLQKDAPIYLAPQARPDFGQASSALNVSVECIEPRQWNVER
jgi:beta-galactosidase